MTIEERAEMILSLLDVDKKLLKSGLFEAVVGEIRETVDMAQLRQMDVAAAYWKPKIAEAYENAAKIVDPGFGCSPERHELALKIRARKDEVTRTK